MFKLLTEEERQKVAHEYNMHRIIVILCALIAVLVVGVIGLLPSFVLSNARYNDALEQTRTVDISIEEGNESNLGAWLKETNHRLQVLSSHLDTDRPADSFQKILDEKIAGVRLTDFSWIKTKDNKVTLSVSGTAIDRQSLIVFENRISSSKYFRDVTLPISNLAKDKDIDFQIKFSQALLSPSTQTP